MCFTAKIMIAADKRSFHIYMYILSYSQNVCGGVIRSASPIANESHEIKSYYLKKKKKKWNMICCCSKWCFNATHAGK